MQTLRITFEYPWLLLLLIPAAVMMIWTYFRQDKKYRKNRNLITSTVLHSIVLLLSIFVLSGMKFVTEKPNRDNEIMIVVDVSDSSEDAMEEKENFIASVIAECKGKYKMGIVTFGYDQVYAAPITEEVETIFKQYRKSAKPDTTATNIEGALLFAKEKFTNPQASKIVLLSDGIETDEKANNSIKKIAAEGIKVDTVFFKNDDIAGEVQIIGAEKPDYTIKAGDSFNMALTVQSSFGVKVDIQLLDKSASGEVIATSTKSFNLAVGSNPIEFPHVFEIPGMHELEFVVTAQGDSSQLNNKFITYVNLETHDKILIIEREQGAADLLAGVLTSENVKRVVVTDSENMPKTVEDLRKFDEVILLNIANADMPAGFIEELHSFVYDFGGGMLTVGGNKEDENGKIVPNMYNRADMVDTRYGGTYQQMLPVQCINYTPPLAVMLLIDSSGSMGVIDEDSNRTLLELAQDGAVSCLNALTERDYCSVMSLTDVATESLACTSVADRTPILKAIQNLSSTGGTVFTGPIRDAGQALNAVTRVEKKHIILVSDCITDDGLGSYGEVIKRNRANGITMSIIHIGGSANASDVRIAAEEYGGGRYYGLTEYSQLPDLMREDLKVPEIKEVEYKEFKPQVKNYTPVVDGVLESDIPTLDGYYGTKAKLDAEVTLSGEFVPIYAQWKYGKGSVGSFMCDLQGIWSSKFMSDLTGQRIINNMVSGLYPMENIQPQDIEIKVEEDNYTTNLQIYADVAETETIEVTVTGPVQEDGKPYSEKIVADSNNYSNIDVEIKKAGLYNILVEKKDSFGNSLGKFETYRTFSYSKEYDLFYDVEENELFLEKLAEQGKGKFINKDAAYQVKEGFSPVIRNTFDPRILFIIISIVLFLLDIAVRKFKFKWPHELIKDYKYRKGLENKSI
ncbi:MAG: VWA domain-containing protein [Clostridiales bacterium]|nr:VWA domain-containing protein [Clostridiales bacterium]